MLSRLHINGDKNDTIHKTQARVTIILSHTFTITHPSLSHINFLRRGSGCKKTNKQEHG